MKFLSLPRRNSGIDYSHIYPCNTFCVQHHKGSVNCLEYGDYTNESILLFCSQNPNRKLINLIDDFLDAGNHVILAEFKNSADILAVFFRVKTTYPMSIYSFQDKVKTTQNTLNKLGFSCTDFNPKPIKRQHRQRVLLNG